MDIGRIRSRLRNKSFRDLALAMLNYIGWNYYRWMPNWLRAVATPNFGHILKCCTAAAQAAAGKRILDAGAGRRPYNYLFSKSNYESTDYVDPDNVHSFCCSLEHIPVEDGRYDVVLCTEVLEHVKNPRKAVSELFRILKNGGKLYLTAPLQARFHSVPHHYYNFTESGLRDLLDSEGFKNVVVEPNGGAFHFIANNIGLIPQEIYLQQVRHKKIVMAIMALPFLLVGSLVSIIMGPILYCLDVIDSEKYITSGYCCVCQKE